MKQFMPIDCARIDDENYIQMYAFKKRISGIFKIDCSSLGLFFSWKEPNN